ncbi:MAG TPA: pilus assembly protein PilM [Candidatus Baltobacteraceae bacterium]|jgi:Tfp pilus assembly PilM family ATPase
MSVVGIDIGTSRVRIAYGRGAGRMAEIEAVIARDLPADSSADGEVVDADLVATVIEDMIGELGVRARDCVCAVGPPVASLRLLQLPRMSPLDRERAARIDVERRLGRATNDVIVRTSPVTGLLDGYLVGAVAGRALRSRTAAVRRAGLRARAVDFEGSALARAFPDADAILDVGTARATLHAVRDGIPTTLWSPIGGAAVTAAIREDLGVEQRAAETRKRSVGAAGAGAAAFEEVVAEASTLVRSARRRNCSIERLALFGNGSRLTGLRAALERAGDVRVVAARPAGLSADAYPDDVALVGAADWGLAIGLARWDRR